MWIRNTSPRRFAFTLFVFAIGVVNTFTVRSLGVLAGVFAAIALFFGVTIVETQIGKRIWEQQLASNRAIGDDAVERIRAYVKTNGETPTSFADVGLVEPIELKRGDYTSKLEYERRGNAAFTVSFLYGWYRHLWESDAGHWDRRELRVDVQSRSMNRR